MLTDTALRNFKPMWPLNFSTIPLVRRVLDLVIRTPQPSIRCKCGPGIQENQ